MSPNNRKVLAALAVELLETAHSPGPSGKAQCIRATQILAALLKQESPNVAMLERRLGRVLDLREILVGELDGAWPER